MTDGRTFDAETRLLFRVALAIFTVTVLIGLLINAVMGFISFNSPVPCC